MSKPQPPAPAGFPNLLEVKGFSERNIKLMVQFAHEYPDAFAPSPTIGQPPVAQLPNLPNGQQLVAQIPWAHNVLLIQRVKDRADRLWYMRQTLANGWSRNVLLIMIKSGAHRRQGQAVTNFEHHLPAPQSDLARQTLKDPYIFDVRHDNRVVIADSVSRILGRRYLSRPTYLGSKDDRDHSLLVKRWWATKCPDPRAARLAK